MTISIPLSKQGKHKGKYVAIIDDCDEKLLEFRWTVFKTKSGIIYAKRFDDGKTVLMHQLILESIVDRSLNKNEVVDHRDGNGLNNTHKNLRFATRSQNNMNQKRSVRNKSGYKGVSWSTQKQKYQARIAAEGCEYHLGFFDNPKDAHNAYCEKAKELFGEFANFG